jgi:hypothetical protein
MRRAIRWLAFVGVADLSATLIAALVLFLLSVAGVPTDNLALDVAIFAGAFLATWYGIRVWLRRRRRN